MRHDSDQIPTRGRTFQNCTSDRPEVPDATRFHRLLIGLQIASNSQKNDQSMFAYGNWRPIGDPIAANKINRESLVLTIVSRRAVTQKSAAIDNMDSIWDNTIYLSLRFHNATRITVILYILRFSYQIFLCEKAFRILLRPIREAKRVLTREKIVSFLWLVEVKSEKRFFTQENLSMYQINKLQHGKRFVRDFHTRCWSIRNLTRSI